MPKWLLNQNANNIFFIQNLKIMDIVHLRIVKLKSGGQQLPLIKKIWSGNSFDLEKPSFY